MEEGCDDWHELAERTARAIREIDPQRAIIVEPPPWGWAESLADFTPIAVPNVVYSVHMYVPHQFTHQGVHGTSRRSVSGRDRRETLGQGGTAGGAAAGDRVQRTYSVHIYIGEFSAIRWAPDDSAYRYLRDVIELFEEHGWDWSYHAFREWNGWSVEHGPDPNDPQPARSPPTARGCSANGPARTRNRRGRTRKE